MLGGSTNTTVYIIPVCGGKAGGKNMLPVFPPNARELLVGGGGMVIIYWIILVVGVWS